MRHTIGLALIFLLFAVPTHAATLVTVPHGTAAVLDGTLAEGEWSDALQIRLNDQAHLMLKHADGFLFLGIQATTRGFASPLIVGGGEILVLHASAALGTAIYAREGDAWTLRQDYVYECRSTGFYPYALTQRARFLEQNGWLGTIVYLGDPTQFEYQILWGDGPLTFLFMFMEFTDPIQFLSWPLDPTASAPYSAMISADPTPAEFHCTLDEWATLEKGDALQP
jgi:hypothetical protein